MKIFSELSHDDCASAALISDAATSFGDTRINVITLKFPHQSQHSASIANLVDHASGGGIPCSTALCEFTRDFHPVLSPSCVVETSRSGDVRDEGAEGGP